jgi:hypothetical protein
VRAEGGVIIAIDPGNEASAFMMLDAGRPVRHGKQPNTELLAGMHGWAPRRESTPKLVVEMIASYGMPVGREVFETCVWIGRFAEAWATLGGEHALVYRREVKLHLCGSARAKDGNVRQALIDRFGPGRARAIGIKRQPGPLYGVSADVWAALAVAVTYHDTSASSRGMGTVGSMAAARTACSGNASAASLRPASCSITSAGVARAWRCTTSSQ